MSFQLISSQKSDLISAGVLLTGPSDRIQENVIDPADGYRKIDPQGSVCFNIVDSSMYFSSGTSWKRFSSSGGDVKGIIGTPNQIFANGIASVLQDGVVTLTLPQSIGTTSNVRFSQLGLGIAAVNNALSVNGSAGIGYGDTAAPTNGLIVQGSTCFGSSNATTLFNAGSNGQFQINTNGQVVGGEWNGSAITVPYGGTGQSSFNTGELLYANTTSSLARLPAGTLNYLFTSGGVGTAPLWQAAPFNLTIVGTAEQIDSVTFAGVTTISIPPILTIPGTMFVQSGNFRVGSANQFSINTSGVVTAGVWNGSNLTEAYGGTGQTTYTIGDILSASGTTTLSKINAGANSYILTSNGPGVLPVWAPRLSVLGTNNNIDVSSNVLSLSSTLVTPNTLSVTGNFSSPSFNVGISGVVTGGTWRTSNPIQIGYGGALFDATTIPVSFTGTILGYSGLSRLVFFSTTQTGYVLTSQGGVPSWQINSALASGTPSQILVSNSGVVSLPNAISYTGTLAVTSTFSAGAAGFQITGGTVTTGTWTPTSTAVGLLYGGLNALTNSYRAGAIVYSSTASLLVAPTVGTAGRILLSNGTAAPTFQSTGVTSVTGANAVSVDQNQGAVTLTLPQDVNTTATVQFGRLGLAIDAVNNYFSTIGNVVIGSTVTGPTFGLGVTGNVSFGASTAPSLFNVGGNNEFQVNSTGVVTAGTWNGSTLDISYGGTGLTSGTQYGLIYFPATTTMASTVGATDVNKILHGNPAGSPSWSAINLATDITGIAALTMGGTGVSLSASAGSLVYSTATVFGTTLVGTTGNILHSSGGVGAPTWAQVSLTAEVSGILPLTNGGTNRNFTAAAGGVVFSDATTLTVSAAGTSGQVLHSNGTGTPTWSAVNLATEVANVLPLANGGTGSALTAAAGGVASTNATQITLSSSGVTGQYLGSNGTSAPTWKYVAPSVETIIAAGSLSTTGNSIVDASTGPFTVTLGTATEGQTKFVQITPTSSTVTVDCTSGNGGVFTLDINTTRTKDLLYYNNQWTIQTSTDNVTSFYPTTQVGTKIPSPYGSGTRYGLYGVSISGNSNYMAVGSLAPLDIYARNGSSWTYQTSVADGEVSAFSEDGSTAAFGATSYINYTGSVVVYTRSGSTWTQQTRLTVSPLATNSYLGSSVALSADGNTLAAGMFRYLTTVGACVIFVRSGTSWSQQAFLNPTFSANYYQGSSVALSSDGNTLAFGINPTTGAAQGIWIYRRTGTSWAQSTFLSGSTVGPSGQGLSIELSADGNTLVSGGYDTSGTEFPVAWVFTCDSSLNWTQQAKIVPTGYSTPYSLGANVSVTNDGNTLVLGYGFDNSDTGATWVFTRYNGVWTQKTKLVGTGAVGGASQRACAISGNGSIVITAGPQDASNTGALWTFF